MYLLDTNHCSDIFTKRNINVINKLRQLPRECSISINAVVYGELMLMVEKSERKLENLGLLNSFLKLVKIYKMDEGTAILYGSLHAEIFRKFAPKDRQKRRNFRIKEVGVHNHDLWIACTAIQHDLILVSSDSDFARIGHVRDLKLESWRVP